MLHKVYKVYRFFNALNTIFIYYVILKTPILVIILTFFGKYIELKEVDF